MFGLPKEIAGTIIAALIAAFVSLVGLIISKENKVSEFRQAWIDALRDEIASIITHAHAVYGEYVTNRNAAIPWQNVKEDFVRLNAAWAKVKLRLNPNEKKSQAVLRALEEHERLFPAGGGIPSLQRLEDSENTLLSCTQIVLKEEWKRVKRGEFVYRGTMILMVLLLVGGIYVLLRHDDRKNEHHPTLQETVDYMARSLASHNGQRIQQPPLSAEVKLITRLTQDGCRLTYELSQFDILQLDLGDIDTQTVRVEPIGNTWWAVFKTRNFSKSVQYKHPKDLAADYAAENGGFSLDEQQTADSFAKALTHAAEFCGGRPSTF